MQRSNSIFLKSIGAGILAVIIVTSQFLFLQPGLPGLGPASADGQQPSPVTLELRRAFSAAAPGERIPVVIQLSTLEAPRPIAHDRIVRAAEHASNLANLYGSSAERLSREVPADLAFDLFAGEVLWIGGAIAAEVTEEQLASLESSPRVSRLHYDGLIRVDLAGDTSPTPPLLWAPGFPASQVPGGGRGLRGLLPPGLVAIGAPEVWARGATGQGSVVAIIDSGVDGTHPMLNRNWRGLTTSPDQAWFDPWGLTDVPVDDNPFAGVGHGTIVAMTAVGSLEPGDTLIELGGSVLVVQDELEVVTGVAPGAEWVAVNAFEEFGGSTYTRRSILLQGMQWAVDPDGNPGTVSDIPDVVNNSWGFASDGCSGLFDRAIDALELSGVPVVFAAGNRAPGIDTVASPASRADLLLNAFAVGAAVVVDGEISVADNSLGGPSPCGPDAIKPEVVAPGVVPVIRAQSPTTAAVSGFSGPFTSWAAPHSSGSLAVLRGLDPTASSSDLKAALFSTAEDLDPPGPDNRSGAGFIDLEAAAGLIGGLGGVSLELTSWSWDSTAESLTLLLYNGGRDAFLGGSAELRRHPDETLASATAPAIAPRRGGEVRFSAPRELVEKDYALRLRLESEGVALDFPLRLSRAPVTAVVLEDGAVQFSIDANGRLGQVAGPPGFTFLSGDWLTAGALLYAVGDVVSDAAYVDVLARPVLKPNPVGSDTDWRGEVTTDAGVTDRAAIRLSDGRALRPLGAEVEQKVQLVSIADSAAFFALDVTIGFEEANAAPLAGLLLDWDLAGRDSVTWDPALGASVMTAADSAGPWVALTTAPRPPTTQSAIPLGSVSIGSFELGTGVLAEPSFPDSEKSRLMRLGGDQSSRPSTTDWAQMVTVGPIASGERIIFLVAVGGSEAAMRMALDSARAFAAAAAPDGTAPSAVALQLLSPFPNPFDPAKGQVVKLPFLVNRGQGDVEATLQIYTIYGLLLNVQRRVITADVTVEPFQWDGRVNGEAVSTGVYGYIIQVGRERQSGKFVVLK